MKNIQWQVTSLELSKKLKEVVVKQESYFSYIFRERMVVDTKDGDWHDWELIPTIANPTDTCGEQISAFTVAELGEMLPEKCFVTDKQDGKWWNVKYLDPHDVSKNYTTAHEGEADARGKMLIYLLENNLIDKKAYEKICTII